MAAHSVRGVGSATLASLLRGMAIQRVSPADVSCLTAGDLRARFGIPHREASGIAAALRAPRLDLVAMSERLHRAGGSVVTLLDAAYPARLTRWMSPSPPVLYLRGDAALLNSPLIAVANSNGASASAVRATDAAVSQALDAGFTPVTGHNRPEYQQAALVARRRGAPVCYVLDRGLVTVLENRDDTALFHAARIWPSGSRTNDLVLSTCPPLLSGAVGTNRLRDATVMALATAIVAAHVRPGGRMASLLEQAIRSGRPVAWLGEAASKPANLSGPSLTPLDAEDASAVSDWLARTLPGQMATGSLP